MALQLSRISSGQVDCVALVRPFVMRRHVLAGAGHRDRLQRGTVGLLEFQVQVGAGQVR